jgi:DNA-binding NarL/FixJ family response regulator
MEQLFDALFHWTPEMSATDPTLRKRRIFLVDDHSVVREGLRSIINQEPDLVVCGEAADGATALANIRSTIPDLIVADLSLGDRSGLELLKDLTIHHPSIPVFVLSMHDEAVYADRVLKAGARGYLMKAESSERLLTAIRRVLDGNVYVSQSVVTAMASRLGADKHDRQPINLLSDRELQLFEMIGRGLSTSKIAELMNVSIKTAQAYVTSAKEKLGVPTMNELLREAIRWRDSGKGTSGRAL